MRALSFLEITQQELQAIIRQAVQEAVAVELKSILPQIIRPPTDETDTYLTRQQVCEILQISLPTLSRLNKDGLLKAQRLGKTMRYSKKSIILAMQDIRSTKYKKQ